MRGGNKNPKLQSSIRVSESKYDDKVGKEENMHTPYPSRSGGTCVRKGV